MLEKSIDKYGKRAIIESETGERKRKKQTPSKKRNLMKVISQKWYYKNLEGMESLQCRYFRKGVSPMNSEPVQMNSGSQSGSCRYLINKNFKTVEIVASDTIKCLS